MAQSSVTVGAYTLTAEDLHPRDGIRWAVGEPSGRRSSTWRLWGDKKGDAYLAMRSLGGQLKVSIHRDRRCSVGFTKEFEQVARKRFGEASRHWKRWILPAAAVARVVQLVIPNVELSPFRAIDRSPMAWIPAPGVGRAVVFSVFVAEPPNAFNWQSPETSGKLLGTMLSPTRLTWLVYGEQELDSSIQSVIETVRADAKQTAAGALVDASPSGLRMAFVGQGATSSDIFLVELDASTFVAINKENAD